MQGLNLAHDGLSVVVVVVVEVIFAGLVNGAVVEVVDGRVVINIGFVVVGMVVVEAEEVGVGVVEDLIVVVGAVVIVVDLNLGLNLWDLRRANGDLSVVVVVVVFVTYNGLVTGEASDVEGPRAIRIGVGDESVSVFGPISVCS